MKVRELVGKELMNAYDGRYLSDNFGYSCANFNVADDFFGGGGGIDINMWRKYYSGIQEKFGTGGKENDAATFELYTENTHNISCFVCYDDNDKICGRRMFFRGKSMINDDEFDVPLRMGKDEVRYLYGYYGEDKEIYQREIYKAAFMKYGQNILYTDSAVYDKMRLNPQIKNFWIMKINKTNFPKYPPVDHLSVSTELNALSNFSPKKYIIEVLEHDYKKKNVSFHQAYRFKMGAEEVTYDYKTWDTHKGVITSADDYTKAITAGQTPSGSPKLGEEIKTVTAGEYVRSTISGSKYLILKIKGDLVRLQSMDKTHEWDLSVKKLKEIYVMA